MQESLDNDDILLTDLCIPQLSRVHLQNYLCVCVCRCEISKNLCCRNLAVEKAVSELPTECTFCLKQFPRSSLERHQKEECQDRYSPQKLFFLLPLCSLLNVPKVFM